MNQPLDRADMAQATDPLPSWNDGLARRSIVEFVTTVTKPDSPDFVPIAERIAVFDNDGTLWAEQPTFFQALFAFDRIRQLAIGRSGRGIVWRVFGTGNLRED
jgi:hypothetical protein